MASDLPDRFVELSAEDWAQLGPSTPGTSGEGDLRSFEGRPVAAEVERVYLPLARLLDLRVVAARELAEATGAFLGRPLGRPTFVIGVAGSVAVGKSTTARLLQALLSSRPATARVDLVTTDGFLHPNAVLEQRGLLARKGFPESYDVRQLLAFLAEVRSGRAVVDAPVYSHVRYDIVPGQVQSVRRPDILVVEGLNILSTAPAADVAVSDLFDFTIYVDAEEADIEAWYVARFLGLCDTVFQDPASYFHRYAALGHGEAVAQARGIWARVNAVNLRENILPTRERANLILEKGPDHRVGRVRLRPS